MTHHHDLFCITVRYNEYIPKGIQVTKRTRICIKKHQRGDNSKSFNVRALNFASDTLSGPELSNLQVTHCQDLFYIAVKYHQNIPNGIQVTELMD